MFHAISKVHAFTRNAIFAATLGSLMLAMGCGQDIKISKQITQPAEINMAGRKVIMLKPVTGLGGEKISGRLKESLGTKDFTIVDRAGLSDRTTEGGISSSGEGSDDTAERQKITQPGVIIRGKVLTNRATQHVEQQLQQEGNRKKGTYHEYYVWRAVAVQNVEVTFDVVDLHTLEIIKSATIKKQKDAASEFQPNFNNPQITEFESMQDDCYDQVVDSLMKKIAPYEATLTMTLLKIDDNPNNDSGIVSVQTGDYASARASFEAALAAAKTKPNPDAKDQFRIQNNIGCSYVMEDKFTEAAAAYTKANDPEMAKQCKKLAKNVTTLSAQPHAEQ